MLGTFNKNFLSLIAKKHVASSFEEFRPISCCNLIYKLISKIIVNRLKPMLSDIILEEQFSFIFKRKTHDAVSLDQEASHSIKSQKIPSFTLKIDLSKAYDKFSWVFIRIVLIQMGMNLHSVNWIMRYISSAPFVVLINDSPSNFFHSSRGLRHGFPLSPFLFLIVVEGWIKLFQNAKNNGMLKGLRISDTIYLTHLLFANNVMIFGASSQ
jgi:hypothetical protein